MPDAVATSKEQSEETGSRERSDEAASRDRSKDPDSQGQAREVESEGHAREVDSQEQAKEVDSPEGDGDSRALEIEVACPHCDRPTSVRVSNADAEIHVRRYVAGFGAHTTAHCEAGHEFWIYYC